MDQRAQRIVMFMKDNLNQETSLTELAQSVNLSSSRLRHIFKAETGMTPIQCRKSLRMQVAKEYLETTFLRVKEIAFRVGYIHEGHFVRDFKKTYDVSPGQYRARWLVLSSSRRH
jgi:transcriptional regulator GlxA family with amidase domain